MSHSLLRVQPKSHYKEENGYASQKSNSEETLAFYGNGIVIIRQRPPILLGGPLRGRVSIKEREFKSK